MVQDAATLLAQFEPKPVTTCTAARQLCSARFSPCGRFLVAGGYDGLVRRWDATADDLRELTSLSGHNGWVQEVAFAPAGDVMFTADSWGQLRCWPYAEDNSQPRWTVPAAHDGWIRAVAVGPDGALVATCGSDRAVRVWSAADGAKKLEWADHGEDVLSAAFHPGGAAIVSGDLKGAVRQWDLAGGTCTRTFDAAALFKYDRLQDVGGARCLAFNADGSLLAVAGTKPANGGSVQGIPSVLLFDWASGEPRGDLDLGQVGDVYVFDLRFHAAGFLMAVTNGNSGTGKLVFRRPEDATAFYETASMANIQSLALHPNGRRLAVVATNTGSNGNGRNLNEAGEYPGNFSPIHLLDLPA